MFASDQARCARTNILNPQDLVPAFTEALLECGEHAESLSERSSKYPKGQFQPEPLRQLLQLDHEIRKLRIVSHAFDMGSWKPQETLNASGSTVYFWTIPAKGTPEYEAAAKAANAS